MADECKHLNAIIRGDDTRGFMYCPDCGQQPRDYEVLNNFLDEMRKLIAKAKE